MKTYKISYEALITGTVQAKNEQEARELAMSGEVETTESELLSDCEVVEIKTK